MFDWILNTPLRCLDYQRKHIFIMSTKLKDDVAHHCKFSEGLTSERFKVFSYRQHWEWGEIIVFNFDSNTENCETSDLRCNSFLYMLERCIDQF